MIGLEPFGLNTFDVRIELFLNHLVDRSHIFNFLVTRVGSADLLHGGVIMLLVWYVLFKPHGEGELRERDELLLGTTLLSMVAVLVARVLAFILPFRTRPIATPAIHFQLPPGGSLRMAGWSSFPSDHAVLFFTLATGIFFVSRPLGWFALGWAAAGICFPRMYLGIHWPTDILAGAALGVAFAQIARISAFRSWVAEFTTRWHREQPGVFFAALFMLSYQIVILFDDARRLLSGVLHWILS